MGREELLDGWMFVGGEEVEGEGENGPHYTMDGPGAKAAAK